MRAGCQVGTKADELLQGAPRVPPSEVLPIPDTPDTPNIKYSISIKYIFFFFFFFTILSIVKCNDMMETQYI